MFDSGAGKLKTRAAERSAITIGVVLLVVLALPALSPIPARGASRQAKPSLAYSTYLGRGAVIQGRAVVVDRTGNAYVGVESNRPCAGNCAPGDNGFVLKLNAAGTRILFTRHLPGRISSMAPGPGSTVLVTGSTGSTRLPLVHAFQTKNHGGEDAFVVKLSATGTILYSTYLGGQGTDQAGAIAVDPAGNAYLTGITYSTDFPTLHAFQQYGGSPAPGAFPSDAFVAKLDPAGRLVYSSYLGSDQNDGGQGIAVDPSGEAFVSGFAGSAGFPTVNPLPATQCVPEPPGATAFLARISASGDRLIASTCLSRGTFEFGGPVALDAKGGVYVATYDPAIAGTTTVLAFSATQQPLFRRSLAGRMEAMSVRGNRLYLVGTIHSSELPVVNALQSHYRSGSCHIQSDSHDCEDAAVVELSTGNGRVLFGTYLGGRRDDEGHGLALDRAGSIYLVGTTTSSDFPVVRALQPRNQGRVDVTTTGPTDAFITKLAG